MNARILHSAKFQGAIIITVLSFLPVVYQLRDPDIPRKDKTELLKWWTAATTAVWLGAIGATGYEDGQSKRDAAPQTGSSLSSPPDPRHLPSAPPAPPPPEYRHAPSSRPRM